MIQQNPKPTRVDQPDKNFVVVSEVLRSMKESQNKNKKPENSKEEEKEEKLE